MAGIEEHRQEAVRFAAVAFEVRELGPREDVPVHMAEVVARRVRAVLGELLAEAEVRRPVQTGDEAVHNGLRDEVEAGNTGEDLRGEEALRHLSPSAVRGRR